MTEPAEPARAPSWRESRWIRRLPLLLVAAVGFFFLLPKVPHEVELDYNLGRAARGAQQVEVEVLDSEGHRLRRTVVKSPDKHVLQKLKLPKGGYRAELELTYPDRIDRRARSFDVGEGGTIDLDVEQP